MVNPQGEEHSNCRPDTKNCYPGADVHFTSTVFLRIYDREEALEQHEWPEEYKVIAESSATRKISRQLLAKTIANRPTMYYVMRVFDSVLGFHEGYLDLSGRHPERYYQLQSQWNTLLYEFLGLERKKFFTRPEGGKIIAERYNVIDAGRWQRFQIKWRLPVSIEYDQILGHVENVLRELDRQPVPRFQKINFVNLPNEVLDSIFGFAPITQSKELCCTCHKLNSLGQRHIFRTWNMTLHVPSHIAPNDVQYSSIDLPTLAYFSCEDLEKNAEFVKKTPSIAGRIQKLDLSDEWNCHRKDYPEHNNPFNLTFDVYKVVEQSYFCVLKAAIQVSTLVLSNIELTFDILRVIGDTPTLHTLDLFQCDISSSLCQHAILGRAIHWRQIVNLHIFQDSAHSESHSQWYSIFLCSRLRTLSIDQVGIIRPSAMMPLFWNALRLDNLERLALDTISRRDLKKLLQYFKRNQSHIRRLTHVMVAMEKALLDEEVITLLSALEAAPLEVLVLEGLAEAEFPLFEHIACQYPDLVGLTLVRRQNSSQYHNKLVVWPHASWEYAPSFKGFKVLRHFCWNFRTEYWDATPSTLLAFESDFASPRSPNDFDLTDEVPYFLDSHWMALPFAAHCPTLRSFCIMDSAIDMVSKISRHPKTGAIALTPKYYPTCSSASWNVQQYNTVASRWPPLLPQTKQRLE